ncbi:ty3-gypsy retrotransposon protein [Fagus crenata]
MELSIAFNGNEGLPVQDPYKGGKFHINIDYKQSLTITIASLEVPIKPKNKGDKSPTIQEKGKRKLMLQEMQEKKYPFLDSDVSKMLDHLHTLQLIELPEIKRPEEVIQTNDPKYCKYHCLISHPVEQCFVLKDKIMELARQGKITFDDDNVVTSNLAMTIAPTIPTLPIQFCSCKPTNVEILSTPKVTSNVLEQNSSACINFHHKEPLDVDEEGWTLVTQQRNHMAKSSKQLKETPRRIRIVKKLEKARKSKRAQTNTLSLEETPIQNPRQHLTLQEFMLEQFQDHILTSTTKLLNKSINYSPSLEN